MRDNIKVTEKVVFQQEVEATKKTVKLPLEIVSINLETGKAILRCFAFKDSASKKRYTDLVSKFDSDKISIDSDIKAFETKYNDARPKLAGGGEMALRISLKAEKDALDLRIRDLKQPTLNLSESMETFSPVKIADVSVFDDLINQITV